jgi:hypothetical protein
LILYDDMMMIYLLPAIGLTPGGSSTVHIYTQTIHRTTQLTTLVGRLLFHADGQAGWQTGRQLDRQRMKKLKVAFRNSSKAPNNNMYNFICMCFCIFCVKKIYLKIHFRTQAR